MIDVDLQAIPNQEFSIQLEDWRFEITVKEAAGCMAASVVRDGVPLVSNVRLVAGSPVLPYEYQERGNFVLTTDADQLPDYRAFGITQFLVYVTPAELAALRG